MTFSAELCFPAHWIQRAAKFAETIGILIAGSFCGFIPYWERRAFIFLLSLWRRLMFSSLLNNVFQIIIYIKRPPSCTTPPPFPSWSEIMAKRLPNCSFYCCISYPACTFVISTKVSGPQVSFANPQIFGFKRFSRFADLPWMWLFENLRFAGQTFWGFADFRMSANTSRTFFLLSNIADNTLIQICT